MEQRLWTWSHGSQSHLQEWELGASISSSIQAGQVPKTHKAGMGWRIKMSLVWMVELDCKESWVSKNWCFCSVVLEKTLESPLDCNEIQLVHPKGDQTWLFTGRTDVEAERPILWPADSKSWLIWKDPDAGNDWGRRRRGRQKIRWLDVITDSLEMGLGGLRKLVMDREAWRAVFPGV